MYGGTLMLTGNNDNASFAGKNVYGGTWNPFTGAHDCKSDIIYSENMKGYIVTTKNKINNLDGSTKPTVIEAIPEVELCSIKKSKKVYGKKS